MTPRTLQWAVTMVFAIREINQNDKLLPNVTLGYIIYDSCFSMSKTLERSLKVFEYGFEVQKETPCLPHAVIGTSSSAISVALSHVLNSLSIPLVSYHASCKCLSDKKQFPCFLRTNPSDTYQATAIAALIEVFQWEYVGTVAADDEYGKGAVTQFISESEEKGVCIAFQEYLKKSRDAENILNIVMKESRARVILLFIREPDINPLAQQLVQGNLSGKILIGSDAWINSPLLKNPEYKNIFDGCVGFALRRGEIPGFPRNTTSVDGPNSPLKVKPMDMAPSEFWEMTFKCTWNVEIKIIKRCTGREQLDGVQTEFADVSELRYSYTTYLAVYAIAHALHDIYTGDPDGGSFLYKHFPNTTKLEPWQLLYYLRKVNFVYNLHDVMSFDENGDTSAMYELIIWKIDHDGILQANIVGSFNSSEPLGKELSINKNAFLKSGQHKVPSSVCSEPCSPGMRKVALKGGPVCCFDCIPCSDGEYSNISNSNNCNHCPDYFWSNNQHDSCVPIPEEFLSLSDPIVVTLLLFVLFGLMVTLAIGVLMYYYRNLPIVYATNHKQSNVLLISLAALLCSSLAFIGPPTSITCPIRESSTCSCLTVTVLNGFSFWEFFWDIWWYGINMTPFIAHVILSGPQVVICVTWALVGAPHPVRNVQIHRGVLVLECSGDSPAWLACVLTYLGLLTIICFSLSVQTYKLSWIFNEPKFIYFSMLCFCLICLAFIPAYNSTEGKFSVATKVLAIIAIAEGIQGCVFIPKCYIIFFKPKKASNHSIPTLSPLSSLPLSSSSPQLPQTPSTQPQFLNSPLPLPNISSSLFQLHAPSPQLSILPPHFFLFLTLPITREGKKLPMSNYTT
uniref:G-protein coupled receptors family 3 profile domain-containing protein n=1 Tax=Eptatretus burgeri TaxID=7764 RepID=A0A8C4RB61_EPTBU